MSTAPACAGAKQAAVYRRRRPERTVLYQTVQAHLETWLAGKCEDNEDGPPLPSDDLDQTPASALDAAEPVPEFEFDQTAPY